ncbi:uncharacterized protein LOC119381667 [Rhipicephalus sanguineus]|uniref:uncharacterized protein LOC119381667 n=1 Tax=Rhipicephalus sanguineus TaxID=34632 RepID=UPI001895243C|nr:uncharacterized protein LOC119381667 [Rhipicephalus sanguineus]
MLLLKRAIFENTTRDVRAILALDLSKAFDRVSQRHILTEISSLNLGQRFHDYTQSFLADRKAHLRIGTVSEGPYELGNCGTPQGSVLSPLLLNIAMHKLSTRLAAIPNVGHGIYADDITIWAPGGSLAMLEHSLQSALEATEDFLSNTGLELSPDKSELLLYRPSRKGVRNLAPLETLPIEIRAKNGQPIPRRDSVKILGLLIDARGCNSQALNRLTRQASNVLRLVSRVSNRRGGLKEDNLLRAYQTFFLSNVLYIAPYLNWAKAEKAKLDSLIRTGLKRVLSLPHFTGIEKLLKLGLHNTADELIEAHRAAHITRLSSTKPGIKLLAEAGIQPRHEQATKVSLSRENRNRIMVDPARETSTQCTIRVEDSREPRPSFKRSINRN